MHSGSSSDLPASISSAWRIGIVHAAYHADLVEKLVAGAERVLLEAGIASGNVRRYAAPGSFEIPLIGSALLKEDAADALIGLGVIVQGETHHAALIAQAAAQGMMDLQLQYAVPCAFEILFVDDIGQARARSEGTANRGAEAARSVLHSLAQLRLIRS
ncbi:MAG: 6,7-dimethyl-8-ribityllumazine synthase [Candidatus Peribacteraceae bacterium]|nr:6,7-dimethyl-8-ribityllumazine synthase [Candidatus Peribacteraceae bacterium]